MFPDPCGPRWAEAVAKGADPKTVIPDDFVIVRGGASPVAASGDTFSAAAGPTLETAAAALPHGQVRVTTAGAVRARGGVVEWKPEVSRRGTPNYQHVDVTESGATTLSELQPNPVPRARRIDGDKK